MKLADGQSILFTGDSITDCGRGHPVGVKGQLGDGYVSLIDCLLDACHPHMSVTVLNTGISGNRVIDLEKRWQKDVLALKPDWLSVMIGINDVWRQFDSPHEAEQVDIGRYERVYRNLLEQTRGARINLVVMTPYLIEPNLDDPMRAQMDAYGRVARKVAGEFEATFVDIQAAFDGYLLHRPAHSLCEDRIHPNRAGHMIIARAFLAAMESG
jgi:lysophospholipase L1-like esterase